MLKHLLYLLFIFATFAVSGQTQWNTKSKKAIKLVEQGIAQSRSVNPLTGLPNYEGGIYYFDKAIEKDPNFIDAYMIKADYAARCGKNELAIDAYRKVLAINPNVTSTGYMYFDLCVLEWAVGDYEAALNHAKTFTTYRNANPDNLEDAKWIIMNCEFAIEAMKHPVPFNPINIGAGVNSENPEYFPTLTVDEKQLLFTRLVTMQNGFQQEDFFISNDMNGYWGASTPMPPNINTYNNEGAPTFAPDGRTLIFVGCIDPRYGYGEGRRGYGSCDLFVTEKIGDKWLDPINLPGNVNTANWETQPSLSSDGMTLYFIRGAINGSGGSNKRNGDIYVSKKQTDGSWGTAVKLPNNVNTPYSESSVLIHPDGKTLYFSSDGHVGMGGYDLYMTTLQPDGSWSDPKNLGYPINTADNENSLLVYSSGEIGIFGSDRAGGLGSLDLYSFEMPEIIRPTRTIYMTGTVYDSKTNKKLEAEFSLKDMETNTEVVRSYSDRANGSFLVTLPVNKNYTLVVNKPNYYPYSIGFFLTEQGNTLEPYHQDVPLIPIEATGPVLLDNVFFDLSSAILRKESYAVLDNFVQFLQSDPTLKIELQGHTDARGEDASNMTLSDNRAKSVMQYLISKGIAAERLTAKGYGETKPNTIVDKNGATVTLTEAYINSLPANEQEAAHQLNRRTMYEVKR